MPTVIKKKGIIIKISDTPGKDKLLHIITETGLITAFVTPKRNLGKKSYTFDLFTFAEFVLYETASGNLLVNSITPEDHFYDLRNDIVCLSAASYFSVLISHASKYADMDYKSLFVIFLSSLLALINGIPVKSVKPIFEIKLSQLLGFTPSLEADRKSNIYYFDLNDGRLYSNQISGGICIPRTVALSIYKILNCKVDSLYDYYDVDDKLYNVAEQYIIYHTECNFDVLKFLNGVI